MKVCLHLLLLLLVSNPLLARPTEDGLFAFSASDEVVYYDTAEGNIRVHYSVSGPNVTVLTDNDGDDVPDFVQNVGDIAELSFNTFHDDLDFLMPLSDGILNTPNGGSDAFDFYLVDFNGNGDGYFGLDGCLQDAPACVGHMVVENDFFGYGYPNLYTALEVVVSHEIFHAVQAAYRGDFPTWVSEGTAVWAEKQFDSDSADFIALASNYLEDPSRSLHKPPTGPVPSFAYGTALFWDFLTTRHSPELLKILFEKVTSDLEVSDEHWLAHVNDILVQQGDTLEAAFLKFAQYNLATGTRAGEMTSYEYANELGPLHIEGFGDAIDDSIRLFPMASRYFRLNHQGGPLYILLEESIDDLTLMLHPVSGAALEGPVLEATGSLSNLHGNTVVSFNDEEELNSGGYFMALVRTHYEGQSSRIRFCAGQKQHVTACQIASEEELEDESQTTVVDSDASPAWGCSASDSCGNVMFWSFLLWIGQKKRRSEDRLNS